MEWIALCPGRFTPGKALLYQLNGRMGGPWCRTWYLAQSRLMKAVILYTFRREISASNLMLMIDSPDHICCGFPESQ
jgi:hypothetical protein